MKRVWTVTAVVAVLVILAVVPKLPFWRAQQVQRQIRPGMTIGQALTAANSWSPWYAPFRWTASSNAIVVRQAERRIVRGEASTELQTTEQVVAVLEQMMSEEKQEWEVRFVFAGFPRWAHFTIHFAGDGRVKEVGKVYWLFPLM